MYELHRGIDNGPLEFLAVTGKKKFTDATLPAGAASATYRVTAVRSTKRGPAALFTVNFGVARGGGVISATTTRAAAAA
jgi:hypothetical protein